MLSATRLYEDARKRLDELEKTKQMLERRLPIYPDEKIHIVKSKNRIQYYIRTNPKEKSGTYLSKKNEKKIKQLLQKKYDEEVLKLVNQEIRNIKEVLKNGDDIRMAIQETYSKYPVEARNVIIPIDILDSDFAAKWLSEPYVGKEIQETVPIYMSDKGERVRSKSELNVANTLFKMNIPYKYECPYKTYSGIVIYPDFTVLNVRRRQEIFWEHRGMMDDREYSKHSVQRIKEYEKDGIYLGDRLVITEETISNPLGTDEIKAIIKHYFV